MPRKCCYTSGGRRWLCGYCHFILHLLLPFLLGSPAPPPLQLSYTDTPQSIHTHTRGQSSDPAHLGRRREWGRRQLEVEGRAHREQTDKLLEDGSGTCTYCEPPGTRICSWKHVHVRVCVCTSVMVSCSISTIRASISSGAASNPPYSCRERRSVIESVCVCVRACVCVCVCVFRPSLGSEH